MITVFYGAFTPERFYAEIVSEESAPTLLPRPAAEGGTEGAKLWVVDPLDSTSSYIYRTGPQFPSVMIARPVASFALRNNFRPSSSIP